MDLILSARPVGRRTVVTVSGEIDAHTAGQLREYLLGLFQAGQCHLVLDMEDVDFMDSTGLGVLVGTLKRALTSDGSLRLVSLRPQILKIVQITGLDRVFTIDDDLAAALSRPEGPEPAAQGGLAG